MDISKANARGKPRLIIAKSIISHSRVGVAMVCPLGVLFKIGPIERNTREMLF